MEFEPGCPLFMLFIISLTEPRLDPVVVPETEVCRRVASRLSNLFVLCVDSLSVPCTFAFDSEFPLCASVDNFEDGGEADDPPLTLVISPDLRSTPTIDHGRGLGIGFGLGAIADADAGDTFSSPDWTFDVFVFEDVMVELPADKLVTLGLISGNLELLEFVELP